MSSDAKAYAEGWERTFGSESERARWEREFWDRMRRAVRETEKRQAEMLQRIR